MSDSTLMDQSQEGITLFFQMDSSGTGMVVTGGLTEKSITTFDTPAPNEIQAEMGLLEMTTSSHGRTMSISISIQNYDCNAITVSAGDISLTQPDGPPAGKISPGEIETFEIRVPR